MILKDNPVVFFRQVRSEVAKIVWPAVHEIRVSTIMVMIMVLVASVYFFLSDWVISFSIGSGIGILGSLFH